MRSARSRKGQSLVEGALVLSILLTLMFSIFDLGRAFMCYLALNEAAALAVEYGTAVDNTSATVGTSSYPAATAVRDQATAALGPSVDPQHVTTIQVDTAATVTGRPALKVNIRYEYHLIGPLLGFMYPSGVIPIAGAATHLYPE